MIEQKKMAAISTPRYKRSNLLACKFLCEANLSRLPIQPLEIAQTAGIIVCTYQTLMKHHGTTLAAVIAEIGSDEGCSFYKPETGHYSIFYNLKKSSRGRIIFTLMHELGHIYLRHFIDFGFTKLKRGFNSDEMEIMDKEADAFATAVLAPAVVLRQLKWGSTSVIQKNCGLSQEAAGYRSSFIQTIMAKERYYLNHYESQLFKQFYSFVNQHFCAVCGSHFVAKNPNYCSICGSKNVTWGEGELVYDGIEVDKNGKAMSCPRCSSDEIHPVHLYCKICGMALINRCGGFIEYNNFGEDHYTQEPCGTNADGNARY